MTALKMIIAVLGSLIFLGIFSVGVNSANNQEIASKGCERKINTQEINVVDFTCITAKNTQSNGKG